jgi:hypothetical protein
VSPELSVRSEEDSGYGDAVRSYLDEIRTSLNYAFGLKLRAVLGNVAGGSGLVNDLNEGKKIRGCLACLVGESLGASRELVIPRAVAVELIQAATLIHDDYVDGDVLRRKKPAVWAVVGARRAVLIGDVMFASALAGMNHLSCEDGAAVADAIALMSRGALHEPLEAADLDRFATKGEPDRALYDGIIFLKTGALFGAACDVGAIAAGTDEAIRHACYAFGVAVGKAYQMVDDLTDIHRYMVDRLLAREDLISLAPAIARFMPGSFDSMRTYIDRVSFPFTETVAALLRMLKASLEDAIEQTVESATRCLREAVPAGASKDLLCAAPRAILEMFMSSEALEADKP